MIYREEAIMAKVEYKIYRIPNYDRMSERNRDTWKIIQDAIERAGGKIEAKAVAALVKGKECSNNFIKYCKDCGWLIDA